MNSINSRKAHAIMDSTLYKKNLNFNLKMVLTKPLELNDFCFKENILTQTDIYLVLPIAGIFSSIAGTTTTAEKL